MANGLYYCTLDATDTATLGSLIVFVHVATALAIKVDCEVMTANRFDALVLGTDTLEVDMTKCGGSTVAAGAIPNAAADAAGGLPVSDAGGLDLDTKAAFLDKSIASLNDMSVATLIAGITDDTLDLQEILRVILAATAGKSSGGGTTTRIYRDAADAKARITATVDAYGNRTSMTLDGE